MQAVSLNKLMRLPQWGRWQASLYLDRVKLSWGLCEYAIRGVTRTLGIGGKYKKVSGMPKLSCADPVKLQTRQVKILADQVS